MRDFDFCIDTSLDMGIGQQIKQEIGSRVRSGELPPGARIPSLQQLSSQLGVAVGTVQRAIKALAEEGILSVRPRHGIFVQQETEYATADGIKELRMSRQVALSALTSAEMERLRMGFAQAAPGCRLIECANDRAELLYLPLDLAPAYSDDLEDLDDVPLRLYNRRKPEERAVFDLLRCDGELKILPRNGQYSISFGAMGN